MTALAYGTREAAPRPNCKRGSAPMVVRLEPAASRTHARYRRPNIDSDFLPFPQQGQFDGVVDADLLELIRQRAPAEPAFQCASRAKLLITVRMMFAAPHEDCSALCR
jgi:hypothetical protein